MVIGVVGVYVDLLNVMVCNVECDVDMVLVYVCELVFGLVMLFY